MRSCPLSRGLMRRTNLRGFSGAKGNFMLDCGRQEGADIMEDQILFINLRRAWPAGVVECHVGGVGCGGYGWPRGVMIISGGAWIIARDPRRCLDVGTLV